ncbi:MAG: bifunctional phosphopantothenoylcysteine decarboxylase/phosphopantothenate synthase [Gemmataceae bacterium]|nr:bifunctional phosphopantothenoylcysteine decarboxylase/phosphopantothenate synthase [Gemmataceae bacterium]MDW8267282.1 phosphopantothenoylcysteine decarboxylase [Gemmataceae bacterium]
MNVLVTAGNTQVPIDQVRCLTNVFTGRTGASLALHAWKRGHTVTLLTSHPETVATPAASAGLPPERWTVLPYRTFAQLEEWLERLLRWGSFDVLVHSAAVSDYLVAGVYAPAPGSRFDPQAGEWHGPPSGPPTLLDRQAAKIKSQEPELWLRLERAPKLIDRVRGDWGFKGVLVKFKLEVAVSDDELLAVAEPSRRQSSADLMVANTLEGMTSWAYLGPIDGRYLRVAREELPARLFDAVECCGRGKGRG